MLTKDCETSSPKLSSRAGPGDRSLDRAASDEPVAMSLGLRQPTLPALPEVGREGDAFEDEVHSADEAIACRLEESTLLTTSMDEAASPPLKKRSRSRSAGSLPVDVSALEQADREEEGMKAFVGAKRR